MRKISKIKKEVRKYYLKKLSVKNVGSMKRRGFPWLHSKVEYEYPLEFALGYWYNICIRIDAKGELESMLTKLIAKGVGHYEVYY